MSPKFFLLVVLGLIALIDNSESIKCYSCISIIDGDDCHTGKNVQTEDCPNANYCLKVSGTGMLSEFICLFYTHFFFFFKVIETLDKAMARGCSDVVCNDVMSNSVFKNLIDATCSSCTTDLCNGSGLVKSTMFGSFFIIFLGVLVSNKFV